MVNHAVRGLIYQFGKMLILDRFGELVDLVELDLGDNGIAKLPESFGFLFNLRKISFDNNALTNLPESWINLKK